MWAVSNDTPYAADRSFARDRDGAEVWIVAVRGTFDILPNGDTRVAEKQLPVALAPEWCGEPAQSSLRWDGDLVRTKPGTDVLVLGSAHAPGGRPATCVDVRLSLGPIDKVIRVFGERSYLRGLFRPKLEQPAPFLTMPVSYERAFGGRRFDPETGTLQAEVPTNPIGRGFVAAVGQPGHNLEYASLRDHANELQPAALGPIPAHWQPRLGLAGTYDKKWEQTRQPLVAEDFNDDYFHSAPPDQRVPGYLSGGEGGILENMTPDGLLRFCVPKVRLGFTTFIDGGTVQHRAVIHSVMLLPEHRQLIMVWHTALPCHHALYTLKQTRVIEKRFVDKGEPS